MELNNQSTVWDFVGEYYPGYYQSDEIAHNDDLLKLCLGEVSGSAEELLYREYGGDINNFKLVEDYNESKVHILEKAIEAYLQTIK